MNGNVRAEYQASDEREEGEACSVDVRAGLNEDDIFVYQTDRIQDNEAAIIRLNTVIIQY